MMPLEAPVPLVTTALRGQAFLKDVPLATSPMPQETWTFLDVNFALRVRILLIHLNVFIIIGILIKTCNNLLISGFVF